MTKIFTPLNQKKILEKVKTKDVQLLVKDNVDSTNTFLKNSPEHRKVLICTAEQQTQGRGRLNRPWRSPYGENIYCSFRFSNANDLNSLSGLSLAMSIALHQTLQTLIDKSDLKIKWPNDLLFKAEKIAGILAEIEQVTQNKINVIIGFGINVNMIQTDSIDQAWVSLKKISGKQYDRNKIISELIDNVCQSYVKFSEQGLSPFLSYYAQYDFLFGKLCETKNLDKVYQGAAAGINDKGHLRLRTKAGKPLALHSGSIRVI